MWRPPRDRELAPGDEVDWDDDLDEDRHVRDTVLLVMTIIGIVLVVAVAVFR